MANEQHSSKSSESYEYIVVGSGAGGGPLAANLARHGHRVLLLEAGDDQGQNLNLINPALHVVCSEDPSIRWDFFVKHHDDQAQAAKDPKMTWETPDSDLFIGIDPPPGSKQKGIYYPRAATLGGCTTHNASIAFLPPDEDWEYIASATNDPSWDPRQMRDYYRRLERCQFLPEGSPGHGFNGWLETNHPDPIMLTSQEPFVKASLDAISSQEIVQDVNSPQLPRTDGLHQFTLAMNKRGRRSGPRNYLVATANARTADGMKKYPLYIRTRSLASKILFSATPGNPTATGVEFLQGKGLYKADPTYNSDNHGVKKCVYATREVIVSGGTFNTPQLLKLSGIGPKDELLKFGIPLLVDLPGLGTNLQDTYEYPVIHRAAQEISAFKNSQLSFAGDPLLNRWVQNGVGPCKSDGDSMVIKKQSVVSKDGEQDLCLFGGAKSFYGYYPGYSKVFSASFNRWSWNIIKVHPRKSHAGTVTLRSADPRDMPEVNFRFFDKRYERDDPDHDLAAMADGVALVRDISARIPEPVGPLEEESPGTPIQGVEAIKQDIKNKAYSHHASCTCPIGADDDPLACLDSRFRLRGVQGLRVVDASAFPRVPGTFPVLPIYMISEKATDVILEDARLDMDDAILTEGFEDMVLDGNHMNTTAT